MTTENKTARSLLTALGIGQFNATMVIPYMLIAPATTDPKSSQTVLMVQHIQRALYRMGATDVPDSGRLDAPTARALEQVSGPDWERMSWGGNISAVLAAQDSGMMLRPAAQMAPIAVSGLGGPLDFLPDVPGGLVTYGVAAFLLYRHFTKRRA